MNLQRFHVAFRVADPRSLVDLAIARFGGDGPFCHTELVFPGGEKTFACHARKGCRFIYHQKYHLNTPESMWMLKPVELDQDAVEAGCEVMKGDRYDYLGVLRFVCPILHPSAGRWFCSECVDVLVSLGKHLRARRPYLIPPNDLWKIV